MAPPGAEGIVPGRLWLPGDEELLPVVPVLGDRELDPDVPELGLEVLGDCELLGELGAPGGCDELGEGMLGELGELGGGGELFDEQPASTAMVTIATIPAVVRVRTFISITPCPRGCLARSRRPGRSRRRPS
ncbi:MAG: hypothetical protein AB7I04_11315 [Pseudomonadales bacterium]